MPRTPIVAIPGRFSASASALRYRAVVTARALSEAVLRAGGEQMLFEALAFTARAPLPPGARLDSVLGREPAAEFMKFVLRVCAEGLLAGRPEGFSDGRALIPGVEYAPVVPKT